MWRWCFTATTNTCLMHTRARVSTSPFIFFSSSSIYSLVTLLCTKWACANPSFSRLWKFTHRQEWASPLETPYSHLLHCWCLESQKVLFFLGVIVHNDQTFFEERWDFWNFDFSNASKSAQRVLRVQRFQMSHLNACLCLYVLKKG